MTGQWRVDHLLKGALRNGTPSFHDDQEAADDEVARLGREEITQAVAWCCEGCCGTEGRA